GSPLDPSREGDRSRQGLSIIGLISAICAVAFMIIGEVIAVGVLAGWQDSPLFLGLVGAGVALGALAAVAPILQALARESTSRIPRWLDVILREIANILIIVGVVMLLGWRIFAH
ncbi:hypothetical protein B7486_56835, partial [cyanobacterium TDX16]